MAKKIVAFRLSPIYMEALNEEAGKNNKSTGKMAEQLMVQALKPILQGK